MSKFSIGMVMMKPQRTITFSLTRRERLSFLVFSPLVLAFLWYVESSFDLLFGNSTMDRVARLILTEFFTIFQIMLVLGMLRCLFEIKWLDLVVQYVFNHMIAFFSLLMIIEAVFLVLYIYLVLIPESLKQ